MTRRWYGRQVGRREALGALGALALFGRGGTAAPATLTQAGRPRVAAAADLRVALTALAERFAADGHGAVSLVFGASGALARQIIDGAPFELFLSADEAYVEQVRGAGRTLGEGTLYAEGRLSLYAPSDSPLQVDPQCRGLTALLDEGRPFRFAIANPEHAPYGRAARAVLRHHGLWDRLQPSLVLGENVSQAAQFAASGSTVGGLIAHALVAVPPLSTRGAAASIPAAHHPPLRQRMVLLRGAGDVTRRFHDAVLDAAGRALLERHGFGLPPR